MQASLLTLSLPSSFKFHSHHYLLLTPTHYNPLLLQELNRQRVILPQERIVIRCGKESKGTQFSNQSHRTPILSIWYNKAFHKIRPTTVCPKANSSITLLSCFSSLTWQIKATWVMQISHLRINRLIEKKFNSSNSKTRVIWEWTPHLNWIETRVINQKRHLCLVGLTLMTKAGNCEMLGRLLPKVVSRLISS